MQLGAETVWQGVAMEAVSMVMELFEYDAYLSGETQVGRWLKRCRQVYRRVCCKATKVRPRRAAVAREAGEQGESAGILKRREVLTGVALLLGPIEGVSVTLTASVYFLLPLAPSTTDPAYPEPTPPHRVLTLFGA